jgi:subtilase family serine protease
VGLRSTIAVTVGVGTLVAGLSGLGAAATSAAPPSAVPPSAVPQAAVPQAIVIVRPDVQHLGRSAAGRPPSTADCEASFRVACYEPAQIQQAYNLPGLYREGIEGQGVTIVIVDSFGSPTITADLATFDQTFGLPAPPSFKVIHPVGAIPSFRSSNAQMVSWAGETSLDVEYAHAVAPQASILLVETPVAETEGVTGFPQIVKAEKYVVDHHLGGVISQSFSATEPTFPSRASVNALRGAYTDAARHHVTVLAASGDDGATDVKLNGQTFYTRPVTSWPASDPLVTAVGGTQLHLDANGNRTSPDTVWNDTFSAPTQQFVFGDSGPTPLAAGGGKSILFTRPAYQNPLRKLLGNSRGVPDISMSAACNGSVDVYQSFAGQPAGWYPTCGTSEAAPLFAGLVALADQVAHHSLGLINPALYRMAAKHAPGLVDITSGTNTVSFPQAGRSHTVPGFSARSGYDLASGLGTVNALLFVPELAALAGR